MRQEWQMEEGAGSTCIMKYEGDFKNPPLENGKATLVVKISYQGSQGKKVRFLQLVKHRHFDATGVLTKPIDDMKERDALETDDGYFVDQSVSQMRQSSKKRVGARYEGAVIAEHERSPAQRVYYDETGLEGDNVVEVNHSYITDTPTLPQFGEMKFLTTAVDTATGSHLATITWGFSARRDEDPREDTPQFDVGNPKRGTFDSATDKNRLHYEHLETSGTLLGEYIADKRSNDAGRQQAQDFITKLRQEASRRHRDKSKEPVASEPKAPAAAGRGPSVLQPLSASSQPLSHQAKAKAMPGRRPPAVGRDAIVASPESWTEPQKQVAEEIRRALITPGSANMQELVDRLLELSTNERYTLQQQTVECDRLRQEPPSASGAPDPGLLWLEELKEMPSK